MFAERAKNIFDKFKAEFENDDPYNYYGVQRSYETLLNLSDDVPAVHLFRESWFNLFAVNFGNKLENKL